MAILRRDHFSISRAAEYFAADELRAQTGAPPIEFGHVILKELVDNALDAAEMAGRAPSVIVRCLTTPSEIVLSVADNGPGIPGEIVARLLDFTTRTSSKEAYRSPTRGAQGNAMKCSLGIPIALGARETRLLIEGADSRHEIAISVSVAGDLEISHDRHAGPPGGARITIAFPRACKWTPREWIEGFALFNPHAELVFSTFARNSELPDNWIKHAEFPDCLFKESEKTEHLSFEATANPKKYNASDATPAQWYSAKEFERIAYLKARLDPSISVKAFVQSFKGASRKAGEIAEGFPKLLANADVRRLHEALLAATEAPRPETLGRVGREHFRAALGGRRFWYEHTFGIADGIPFLVEAGVAEIEGPQRRTFGMNYSTTLDQDPIRRESIMSWSGVSALLDRDLRDAPISIAFHLVMPRLPSLDRAKSRVGLPDGVADAAVAVVRDAAKVLLKEAEDRTRKELNEKKRREKQEAADRRKALAELRRFETAVIARERSRRAVAHAEQLTKREAVFSVLPEAYRAATDGERVYVQARDLYYAIRPLYEKLNVKGARGGRELDFTYFSQTLLPEYRRNVSELPLVDYKARGVLYLPYSDKETPIGDRELRSLELPENEFHRVLFIEKTGIWETLKQTGGKELCRRFDMAVIAGEGYASVAIRRLLAMLSERGVAVYVWHDADASGYDISRTLSEETARLPGHSIEIVDLGLSVADALADGLQIERYIRKKALPSVLLERLTDQERELFIGEETEEGWLAGRIEINAIPVKERVAWLEKRLPMARPIGADPDAEIAFEPKYVPPSEQLPRLVKEAQRESLIRLLTEEAYRQVRIPEIVSRARTLLDAEPATEEEIRAILAESPEMSWSEAAATKLPGSEEIEKAVAQIIASMFGG